MKTKTNERKEKSDMFDALRKLLKAPTATSAEIRSQIGDLEGELPQARDRLADLHETRGRVLLEGSDKELDALERELASASRDLDRMDAAASALRKRLNEAEAEEHRAESLARIEAARKASDRGVEALRKYHELASEAAACLAEVQLCEQVVRESWPACLELGADKPRPPIVRVLETQAAQMTFGLIMLPSADGSGRVLWPARDAQRRAEVAEFQQRLRAAAA